MSIVINDAGGKKRCEITVDGTVKSPHSGVVGFLNDDGSAGDKNQEFLGEMNSEGKLHNSEDKCIGSFKEKPFTLFNIEDQLIATIHPNGTIVDSNDKMLGTITPLRKSDYRLLSAYIFYIDPDFVIPGFFSLVTGRPGKAFSTAKVPNRPPTVPLTIQPMLLILDREKKLRAKVTADGSVTNAELQLVGFVNDDGSAGDIKEQLLGEITNEGSVLNHASVVVGSFDESNGSIMLGNKCIGTIGLNGELWDKNQELCGFVELFSRDKVRIVAGYLFFFDMDLLTNKNPSLTKALSNGSVQELEEKEERIQREKEALEKKINEERIKREKEEEVKIERENILRKEREEQEKREKAEKLKKEEELRHEKEKQLRLEKEKKEREAKEKREREEQEKRIKEENERRLKEEQERREIEEQQRREEKEKREKEEKERRKKLEKEEREKLEREEQLRLEREERERFEREEQARLKEQKRREKEEKERLEREKRERLEREEQERLERFEREEQERLEREEQERLEREEQERLEREEQERFEREEQERLEREEQERFEREEKKRLEREEEARLAEEKRIQEELEREENLRKENDERLQREEEDNLLEQIAAFEELLQKNGEEGSENSMGSNNSNENSDSKSPLDQLNEDLNEIMEHVGSENLSKDDQIMQTDNDGDSAKSGEEPDVNSKANGKKEPSNIKTPVGQAIAATGVHEQRKDSASTPWKAANTVTIPRPNIVKREFSKNPDDTGQEEDKDNKPPAGAAGTAAKPLNETQIAIALYDYKHPDPSAKEFFSFKANDVFTILPSNRDLQGWKIAMTANGVKGFVPGNYLKYQDASEAHKTQARPAGNTTSPLPTPSKMQSKTDSSPSLVQTASSKSLKASGREDHDGEPTEKKKRAFLKSKGQKNKTPKADKTKPDKDKNKKTGLLGKKKK